MKTINSTDTSINTSTKRMIKGILSRSFDSSEIKCDYFNTCICYVISTDNDIYEIEEDDSIDFTVASVLFYEKESKTICILATETAFRRQGYASKLLSTICDMYDQLYLYVRESNTNAINLYKNLGFQQHDLIIKYYSYTRINENAIKMCRILN